jgi:hypothetical protein
MNIDIENKLKRLTALLGTDEGFYILALHSFVEHYLRQEQGLGEGLTFPQLTWAFRQRLLDEYGDEFIDGLSSLAQLGKQHYLTNRVRHDFAQIDPEEARAATSLFIRFCRLAGISEAQQLTLFTESLKLWEDKQTSLEQKLVIASLQRELTRLHSANSDLTRQLGAYRDLQSQISGLTLALRQKDLALEEERKKSGHRDGRVDALRQERFTLQEEINRLLKEKDQYRELQAYLEHMGRLTVYTRSRLDYERIIARLSPEQEKVVDTIALDKDSLIRGSAGTGKSLVLISIMKRALAQGRLDFYRENPIIFITYTKTLVKYSHFTARLMRMDLPPVLFSTVDSFIYDRLKEVHPDFSYDFTIRRRFVETVPPLSYISPPELEAELDDLIIGRLITREEYLTDPKSREGMHHRLTKNQREQIWVLFQQYRDFMENEKKYSVNYGRYVASRIFGDLHTGTPSRGLQTVLIDEVQDLNPAALKAVKAMTSGALIMAGDFQQSLYMSLSPFMRAGIDIRGTTRILKTNFRNTRQVVEAAERFLEPYRGRDHVVPVSFREGPPPELFREETEGPLRESLLRRTGFFLTELGYDPENICILAPRNSLVNAIAESLNGAGIPAEVFKSDDFSFTRRGLVNVFTLHSCKGLDFPVILLYLPELARREQYSEEITDRLLRNLIYTGMTRAMDHLNVFVVPSGDPILGEVEGALE